MVSFTVGMIAAAEEGTLAGAGVAEPEEPPIAPPLAAFDLVPFISILRLQLFRQCDLLLPSASPLGERRDEALSSLAANLEGSAARTDGKQVLSLGGIFVRQKANSIRLNAPRGLSSATLLSNTRGKGRWWKASESEPLKAFPPRPRACASEGGAFARASVHCTHREWGSPLRKKISALSASTKNTHFSTRGGGKWNFLKGLKEKNRFSSIT